MVQYMIQYTIQYTVQYTIQDNTVSCIAMSLNPRVCQQAVRVQTGHNANIEHRTQHSTQ